MVHAIIKVISDLMQLMCVVVMVYGLIRELIWFLMERAKGGVFDWHKMLALRFAIGQYFLFGIEFLICSFALVSIMHPSFSQIAWLAGTVLLRVSTRVFLGTELKELKER